METITRESLKKEMISNFETLIEVNPIQAGRLLGWIEAATTPYLNLQKGEKRSEETSRDLSKEKEINN